MNDAVDRARFIWVVGACLVAPAAGQPAKQIPRPGQPVQPQLKRIEQGVGDVDPLRVSLRNSQWAELRRPMGFEAVYRLADADALSGSSGSFFRFDGAITAVIPYSQYVHTPTGMKPVIPAGTIFHIGIPPELAGTPPPPVRRAENSLDLAFHADALPAPSAVPAEPLTLWNSEAYRQWRIGTLLDEAAAGPGP